MMPRRRSFDNLAGAYGWLEWLAFGRDLETARFCHFDRLSGCRRILILGEGDGRFLARLVKSFPDVQVDCLDLSEGMLAKAKSRLTEDESARVVFRHENALVAEFGTKIYDAVVTLFFFDCFSAGEAARLIDRVQIALREEALWLWADFALPRRGWLRLRAQAWLGVLYFFFRWQTGLTVRHLPPTEELLRSAGFALRWERSLQAGLLRSAGYSRSRDQRW